MSSIHRVDSSAKQLCMLNMSCLGWYCARRISSCGCEMGVGDVGWEPKGLREKGTPGRGGMTTQRREREKEPTGTLGLGRIASNSSL